jgi:hypothetical protein
VGLGHLFPGRISSTTASIRGASYGFTTRAFTGTIQKDEMGLISIGP